MLLPILGSVGTGLVWGWLAGSVWHRAGQTRRTSLAIALATVVVAGEVAWLVDWKGPAFFFGAALFTFLIHAAWRRELSDRFGRSN